jgi:hypothetical protein
MNWKNLTYYVIISTIALLAGYDIVAINNGGVDASISVMLYTWACSYPIIPFVLGGLCGHLFWPNGAS